jgi:hypothetical protein
MAQIGLTLRILPQQCWNYRYPPPSQANISYLKAMFLKNDVAPCWLLVALAFINLVLHIDE